MELTESKVKCLLQDQNLSEVSIETFDQIMKIAINNICGKSDVEALSQIYGSHPDIIKNAYADVTKLLIESARCNTSTEELNCLLQSTTVSKIFIDKFCEIYANHKEKLQECLGSIGNSLPHIIDVNWRLDYCVKSTVNSAGAVPMYNLSLSTMKHGSIENIKFTCTIHQLQEIVYKLKDAAKHAEKLTAL